MPQDILEKKFKIDTRGYRLKEVDQFLDDIITDYEQFKATKNESSTEVAKWNGGSLTVEEMFDALTERYGAVITLLFVQQYVVLNSKHNDVMNYVTGEILSVDGAMRS